MSTANLSRLARPAHPPQWRDSRPHHETALLKAWPDETENPSRRHDRTPWAHLAAIAALVFVRLVSAGFNGIADCDETYNYWEPLHLLVNPPPPVGAPGNSPSFKTWEYVPRYAIRSWAYLLQYLPLAALPQWLGFSKHYSFYAVRVGLALTSVASEFALYRAVANVVSERVAGYMLYLFVISAGLFNASTALLPSTFAMYTTTLAWSFAMYPSRSAPRFTLPNPDVAAAPAHRALKATATFAFGALVGWPFALVLSLPFVFEELFLPSGLMSPRSSGALRRLWSSRLVNWLHQVLLASLLLVPLLLVDSLAYGVPTLSTLNIIIYNVLASRRGVGPELYGVESPTFYLRNLVLNFGPIVVALALASGPFVVIMRLVCGWRLLPSPVSNEEHKDGADSSSPSAGQASASLKKETGAKPPRTTSATTLLLLRLVPLYAWLALLSRQPHKEERFMFPAYPLLCFNAAVALECGRAWAESLAAWALGITRHPSETKSKDKAANGSRQTSKLPWLKKPPSLSVIPLTAIALTALFCFARVARVTTAYRAPFQLLEHLREIEAPPSARGSDSAGSVATRRRLCVGKEWHRFPTSFLLPSHVDVRLVRSEFRGILPAKWEWQPETTADRGRGASALWPWRGFTASTAGSWNDENREEVDRYVNVTSCDYLLDLDHAHRFLSFSSPPPAREPRYAASPQRWKRLACHHFLDAEYSGARLAELPGLERLAPQGFEEVIRAEVERAFWLPLWLGGSGWYNAWGDYCLLERRRDS